MSYSFSGPTFVGLFPSVAGAAFVGLFYQSLAETKDSPIEILMIKSVAEYILYKLGSLFIETSRSRAMLYAVINLTSSCAALVAMRQKELIGVMGSAFFVFLMAIELFCKILDFSNFRSSDKNRPLA